MTFEVTPSGVFTSHGGVEIPIYTDDDLQKYVAELNRRFEAALVEDRTEVKNATDAANGPLCSDGYDARATERNFATIEAGFRATIERLQPAVDSWKPTARALAENQTPYDGWQRVITKLDSISAKAGRLTIDSWQSDAGDAYRINQQQRVNETQVLGSLSTNIKNALEEVCILQAFLIELVSNALQGAFLSTFSIISLDGKIIIPALSYSTFTDKGDEWTNFTFYRRSEGVANAISTAIEKINTYAAGDGWDDTSIGIGTRLQSEVNRAKALLKSNRPLTSSEELRNQDLLNDSLEKIDIQADGSKAVDSFW